MKKFISVLLAVILVAACLVGCGSSAPASSAASAASSVAEAVVEAVSELDLNAILTAIEEKNAIANPRDIDDFSIENDFGLSMDDVASYIGKISNDQGNSGLILVVEPAEGSTEAVKTALEAYKTAQVAFFGNYPEFADGMAQVEKGIIESVGNAVVVVFGNTDGASYDDIAAAIKELAK